MWCVDQCISVYVTCYVFFPCIYVDYVKVKLIFFLKLLINLLTCFYYTIFVGFLTKEHIIIAQCK